MHNCNNSSSINEVQNRNALNNGMIINNSCNNNINNNVDDVSLKSISSINNINNNSNNTNLFSNNEELNSSKEHFDSNSITKEKSCNQEINTDNSNNENIISIQKSNNNTNNNINNDIDSDLFFNKNIIKGKNIIFLIYHRIRKNGLKSK